MCPRNAKGQLVMSVCAPLVEIDKDRQTPTFKRSLRREIKMRFPFQVKLRLVSALSGLPRTNSPLDARLSKETLTFATQDGVTDTLILDV